MDLRYGLLTLKVYKVLFLWGIEKRLVLFYIIYFILYHHNIFFPLRKVSDLAHGRDQANL